jgi:multiple sugar transport system permease protein
MARRLTRWDLISYIVIILALAVTLFPFYLLATTSIKPGVEQFTYPPKLVPSTIDTTNYVNIFERWNFLSHLTNSVVITVGSVFLSILLGVPMAYSLTRFRFPRNINDGLAFFILSLRMLPPIVGIIPLFIVFRALNLNDTYEGLILAYTVFNLPLTVWLMRGFYLEFPKEFEEAALVDGCTPLQSFTRVVLPLSLTSIATTATLNILMSWNEFIIAVFLTAQFRKTVPVLISSFIGDQQFFWGEMTAVASLAVIPALILVLLAQRELVRGLTFGAVKG